MIFAVGHRCEDEQFIASLSLVISCASVVLIAFLFFLLYRKDRVILNQQQTIDLQDKLIVALTTQQHRNNE